MAKANLLMKAARQVALHPMVAKVAHLPKTQQEKQVKERGMVKERLQTDKVDRAIAILKAVKVKVIPIVVRVKVMVIAGIPKRKAKAVLMAQVKVKVMGTVAVKKETATIVAVKVAKMLNVPSPKKEMVAIPTPIMRVEIPPIPIQMGKQPIQTLTKTVKKATKVEILPKKAILMVAIREMKAVMATLPASLPKTKMP